MKKKAINRTTAYKGEKEPTPVALSPQRKRLFLFLTVVLPFLFFVLLEMSLRIAGYGGNLDLVIRRKLGRHEFFSINRAAANRYFAQVGTTIPELHDETFELVKRKNTKRVFCIGESTMEGFPYEFNATAPSFLRDRLQTLLPQYNVEVINVGLSAVGSFVVLDFMKELMDYEPDLFIVYVGHNEFYGAYGVGSAVAIKGGAWMTRLTLRLLKFKSFLLLRDAYASALKWLSSSEAQSTGSMMGQMAANKTIPINSPLYNEAKEIYKENIAGLIQTARAQNIPILFSTLVSNWKDQTPFVSVFGETTTESHKSKWRRLIADGDSALDHQQTSDAVTKYSAARELDTLNASAFFKLGKVLYSLQQFDEAKRAFIRAKDLDALRFRATEEFQNILINTCLSLNVPLARVDSAYVANSPHGIVGKELILEHLHPNVDGYFLMAKVFADAIQTQSFIAPHHEWQMSLSKSDSAFMELSSVSEFDRTVGRLKVEFLRHRWPFTSGNTNYEFTPVNVVEAIALKYVQQQIAWSDARYQLAENYANNKQFDLARKECLAVSKVIPFSYNPLLRVADYYRMEGKREESMKAYEHSIAVEDNPYARIKLGLTLLEEEQAAKAAEELETAFRVNAEFGEKLSIEGSSAARYLLAVAYAKMGKFPHAKEQINLALAIKPDNEDAKDLLKQIENLKR